jgi:hypothetical protein
MRSHALPANYNGGSAPATPGFNAVAPESANWGGYCRPSMIPAAESTLGSRPRVALSSAQVIPEWTTITQPCNAFLANGDNPLNFVSHSKGSPQVDTPAPCSSSLCRRSSHLAAGSTFSHQSRTPMVIEWTM